MKVRNLVLAFALALPAAAHADGNTSWNVGKGSQVSFVAKITGGAFEAKSDQVSGSADYDDAAKKLKTAKVVVPVDSLDSGMSLRNRHMKEKYLEMEKFKDLVFVADEQPVDATAGKTFKLKGKMTAHGVTNPMEADAKVESASPSGITMTVSFKLDIQQYGIPQPGFAVVKMDPVIDTTVKAVFERAK